VTGPDLPYTNFAKRALELAMSEARELGQSYVGTEHLLLGLLREAKGIAAQVLEAHGLTVGTVRSKTIQVLVDGGRADRPAVRRVVMEIEYDDGSRTSIACGSIGEAVHLLMSPRAGGTG
jgi:ATP-dependent Clp protease ATP-binding subunit ClpA